jgi:hypothetical protein
MVTSTTLTAKIGPYSATYRDDHVDIEHCLDGDTVLLNLLLGRVEAEAELADMLRIYVAAGL